MEMERKGKQGDKGIQSCGGIRELMAHKEQKLNNNKVKT